MTDKKRISSQFEDEKRDAVDILMGNSKPSKPDKPVSKPSKQVSLSSKPSKPGYKRQTYIVREDYIEKIRAMAYWERREITEVINELLGGCLKDKKTDPIPGDTDSNK